MSSQSAAVHREYLPGHEDWMHRHLRQRSGDRYAAFLLPYLRPAMWLLDCGCGPGTITLDLAGQVEPGRAVGIDIDPKALAKARAAAAERGLRNVFFESGDVYSLPFGDNSFDVVYANTVIMHLREPLNALREIFRVLKPGGVAGISDMDMNTWVHSPEEAAIRVFQDITVRLLDKTRGKPYFASSIRKLLVEAGFARVEGGGYTTSYGTEEGVRTLLPLFDKITVVPGGAELLQEAAVKLGATAAELLERMQVWANRPDAFLMRVYCTGLGWKPGADAAR